MLLSRARDKLISLNLSQCRNLHHGTVEELAKNKCKNLEVLCLDHWNQAGVNYDRITNTLRLLGKIRIVERGWGPGIRSLSICHGKWQDIAISSILQYCPSLMDLRMSGNSITGDSFVTFQQKALLEPDVIIPPLRMLFLADCPTLQDRGLQAAIGMWSDTLQSLDLSECSGLTNRALLGLQKLSKLETLRLTGTMGRQSLNEVDTILLYWSSEPWLRMKEFSISNTARLLDMSLLVLMDRWSQVASLDLSGCARLTDEVAALIADQFKHTLKKLNVSDCITMTNAGLKLIARNCCALQWWNMSYNPSVQDTLFLELPTDGSSPLETVVVNACPEINGSGIKTAIRRCPRLQRVDMNFCHRVRNETVKALREIAKKGTVVSAQFS